ncbi:MAG TPA: tail fiber domain-containing protein [Thermoanaerobaculia bacterium]|nr:tail fiber domain-containing protein [Thermoanaerobaculia bacterium]
MNRTSLTRDRRHLLHLLLPLVMLLLSAYAVQAQPYLGVGAGNPGVSTGSDNTALGDNALSSNTTGFFNTAVGFNACRSNTSGFLNTAVGTFSLDANTTGSLNTAVGTGSLPSNTTGNTNTAVGVEALNSNTTASSNTAVGYESLANATIGGNNTALGANALGSTNGSNNIGIGLLAGTNVTSGSYNIEIGNTAPGNESNTIRIGDVNRQTATFIAGINGATSSSGVAVFVNANGQLGTLTSSLRFKEDVQSMGEASHDLMKLRPVVFHYKAPYDDGSHLLQYGLIAEEVAKVYPDLVQFDDKGQPFTVRYQSINVMLLNEIQKQKAQLDEQEARLKKLEALLDRKTDAPKAP